MTDEKAPPAPLPPAAESPHPDQPAPHPQRDEALEHPPVHVAEGAAIDALATELPHAAADVALMSEFLTQATRGIVR